MRDGARGSSGRAGPPHESGIRQALCRVGRALHEAGLVAGTAGNLSVRLDGGRVLVSPRGVRKDRIAPDDLVALSLDDPDPSDRARASTEWPTHRACYRADSTVGAVLHAHAPGLIAVGLRGMDVAGELPEIEAAVGPMGSVPFAPSGSEELGDSVGRAVEGGARVVLLMRHGAVSVGGTLDEAFDRMELAELAARAVLWGSSSEPAGSRPRGSS